MNTPEKVNLDLLIRETKEVMYDLTDPEPDYDAESLANLQRRMTKVIEQMTGPLSEIIDKTGGLMDVVRHDDTTLARLGREDIVALFRLFTGLWMATTSWGNTQRDNLWPEGDDHKDNVLAALTDLAAKISVA